MEFARTERADTFGRVLFAKNFRHWALAKSRCYYYSYLHLGFSLPGLVLNLLALEFAATINCVGLHSPLNQFHRIRGQDLGIKMGFSDDSTAMTL